MLQLQQLMQHTRQRLSGASESASLDAQVLLAYVLGRPSSWLLAHPEARLDHQQAAQLERLTRRLEAGEPLPYVIGHWEFFGLDFRLNEAVLIPRPETELLVERALAWLQANPACSNILEVGTGSGCIAVALAANCARVQILACDLSYQALLVARHNAWHHNVAGRLRFVLCDLLPPTARKFDLLCANLPYIPSSELGSLPLSNREPRIALDGGEAGLSLIAGFLNAAPAALASGGLVLLEIEASQGQQAADLARAAFPQAGIQVLPDLAGHDRLLVIQT